MHVHARCGFVQIKSGESLKDCRLEECSSGVWECVRETRWGWRKMEEAGKGSSSIGPSPHMNSIQFGASLSRVCVRHPDHLVWFSLSILVWYVWLSLCPVLCQKFTSLCENRRAGREIELRDRGQTKPSHCMLILEYPLRQWPTEDFFPSRKFVSLSLWPYLWLVENFRRQLAFSNSQDTANNTR